VYDGTASHTLRRSPNEVDRRTVDLRSGGYWATRSSRAFIDPTGERLRLNHAFRGIARLLMNRSTEHMRAKGIDIAAVGTGSDPGHSPARGLYESLGYTALPGVRYLRLLA